MNYHESARTRKTGLSTLILNKLMSGGSVGSSIKGALSDRMQSSVMGLKEKFDPLNIASKLTGGSRIGPALLGRMTGRSKEDIDYFANRKRIHRFDNVMNQGHGSGDSRKATEILENIYSFMVKTRESQIKDNHSSFKFEDERQKSNQRHHDEVMNVFNEATKRNRQAVKVIAKPKPVEKPPEAPPAAPPAPPKPGVSPKPEPPKPAPPSAPAPAPARAPTTKTPEPVKAPPEITKSPTPTAKPVPKVEPTPTAAPTAPPVVKPPTAAPAVKPITEVAKTATKVAVVGATISSATDLIAKEEGLPPKGKAYWDPSNQREKVSIGYGHQIKKEEYDNGFLQIGNERVELRGQRGIDTVLTKEQSKTLLSMDMPKYVEKAKNPLGNSWEKLNQNQKDALISYAYNVGSTSSLVKYGLKKAIDENNMSLAAEILREKGIRTAGGNFDPVLDKRRRKEADLFQSKEIKTQQILPPTNLEDMSVDNAEMKKLMRQQSNAQAIVINNTTNVSNRETTVMSGSDKGSENPQYKRA